jgi:Ca2+-binding RTX toxin-like protein
VARIQSRSKARAGVFAGAATVALLAFPGIASAAVNSTVSPAGALTVTITEGDSATITCVGDQVKVNGGDPTPATACAAITSITVNGDDLANTIDLSAVTAPVVTQDPDFPAVTAVTINGGGGNDTITGSEHVDTMAGGAGNDRILGNDNVLGTRDVFRGEAGDDTLVWNPGDDDDQMDGGDGADTIEVNGGGGGEQFAVKPSATPGRVQFDRTGPTPPGPFNLDIGTAERLDMNTGGGDDTFDADGDLVALGFALDVDGGPGNDDLDGGNGPDLITGGDGDDTIVPDDNPPNTRDDARGDAGNDTIVWNGGDDDDLNEGGDGTDTIQVNGADLPEQFTVKPSATAGRVIFDRLNTPPGPFNIDIGTAERLDLNMNGGDDSVATDTGFANLALDVDGGDGNDQLDGGDAPDRLTGGGGNDRIAGDNNPANTRDDSRGDAGDDTLVWNPGDGDDINEGGDGTDTVEVNGGGGGEQFEVKPSATPGRVQFDRTGPSPTPGPFNLDIGTSEKLLLNAGGGDDTIAGSKGLAGLIASTFNGDDGNDRIKGTDGEDALNGGKGGDIIRSRDKAQDLVDCGSGLDLAFVDRRDFLRGCNIVLGGLLKVKVAGKVLDAAGGAAAVKLRCAGTRRCSGTVALKRGKRELGSARFNIKQRSKTVRVRLNRTARRMMAGAPAKGMKITAQIDARDGRANGWRSTTALRLKD